MIVGVTQQVDQFRSNKEIRDTLDHRLVDWVLRTGCVPVPIPNNLVDLKLTSETQPTLNEWLKATNIEAILLSGGNDIGSSPSYMWIDVGTQIYPVNAHGEGISEVVEIDFSESDLIKWGNYSKGRSGELLDISQYLIMDDWHVGLKYIRDLDGYEIHPTVKLEDSNGEIWIGSEEGIL